ncbi:tetratricopeptide (TPR) repeat protein [Parabacteroides sp. PF5-5]|uniref:tetratricopeptide repeat protein n=1 Tax=unclassified Parabacteroides TaxID=2649774 RepID=UPI002475E50A|nr:MULTISPECIES: tetratricopeptide repeat protein [unclassified Parabacteroides]MDH6306300.1 tetratricopeptide (TPR) repeat protein [Parabacteroides sp. PH5-39]MDH6316909.1 tetratricopeptide (TPR) repeat protein [Parabacteroides sp. PF5-13]MDH6320978.1 tetratricopeptide (TPR) repeat protein [Parabacteroides sp. PH5-13]MDH6324710.1 tetratricopeptide (TPR) repeat protein [Parabacteroides sp. PH5-8]MDH6328094.1 tetratricopeptide (TPR) repeat protein [Parabacteroides sp. PH5-41]
MKQLYILILSVCMSASGIAQTASLQENIALAQSHEGALKYRDAYACYQHCLTMDTTNIEILNALARIATNLGKASDAEHYFTKVLQADSTNFYANYQLGRLYYQLGNYDKAIEKYEYLLETDEQNTTLLRNVGDCYLKAGDVAAAIAAYYLAYEHNKENVGLASTLVNILLQTPGTEASDAIAVCDTALYYNPGNRLIRQNKGMALYLNKQYAEADTLYSQLIAEGDSSYLSLKYGGASQYYAGQYLKSVDLLELAYQEDTTSVDVSLLLGSALGKTYDRKRAYLLFDNAEKEMQPKEYMVNQLYLFRGETYQKDGRFSDAARLYYELWKKTKRLNLLGNILNLYSVQNANEYKDENTKQRGLFINVLYVKEYLSSGEDLKYMYYRRYVLESFLEDMFFRNIKEETMIAPDGKRSKITNIELRELANKLPEMPEKIRQEIEEATKTIEGNKRRK